MEKWQTSINQRRKNHDDAEEQLAHKRKDSCWWRGTGEVLKFKGARVTQKGGVEGTPYMAYWGPVQGDCMPTLSILPPCWSYMQIFSSWEHTCCSLVEWVGDSSLLTPTFEEWSCACAVLSHLISLLCPSCDRILIKLQLTHKSCLISQLY